jgi:hypothetical protein
MFRAVPIENESVRVSFLSRQMSCHTGLYDRKSTTMQRPLVAICQSMRCNTLRYAASSPGLAPKESARLRCSVVLSTFLLQREPDAIGPNWSMPES